MKLAPLVPALLLVLLLAACGDAASRARDLRRAVAGSSALVVLVDDLAAARTSLGGCERDTTPFLAELARESVVFRDATAPSSAGLASLAAALAGEAPDVTGVLGPGVRLSPAVPLQAEAFREAGYRTLLASTHPGVVPDAGLERGFDELLCADRGEHGRLPRELVQRVARLAEEGDGRPFLAVLHLDSLSPPRAVADDVALALLGYAPERAAREAAALRGLERAAERTPEAVLAVLDPYDAAVRTLDRELELLLRPFLRAPRERDTFLAVAGTCGQAFGQHGRFGSGNDVHQEQVAVPLVLRFPGGRHGGGSADAAVSVQELLPTLADLLVLGARPRTSTSLVPLFTGDWLERAEPIVARSTVGRPRWALRRDHFKLVVLPNGSALYHLDKDPLEQVLRGEERPETKRDLERELERWRERYEGSGPDPVPIRLGREAWEVLVERGRLPADEEPPEADGGEGADADAGRAQ